MPQSLQEDIRKRREALSKKLEGDSKKRETAMREQQEMAQKQQEEAQALEMESEQDMGEEIQKDQTQRSKELFQAGNALRGDTFNVGSFRTPLNTKTSSPFVKSSSRAFGQFLKRILGNKAVGATLDAGVGVGTTLASDAIFYRNNYDSTGDWLASLVNPTEYSISRGIGAAAAFTGGALGTHLTRNAKDLKSKYHKFLAFNLGLPIGERVAIMGGTEWLPNDIRNQNLEAELLHKQIDGTDTKETGTDTKETGTPWGAILATAGLLGGTGLGAYMFNEHRKQKLLEEKNRITEERGKKEPGDPDRVALEIPSYKLSDGLYNHIGREILFADKEEGKRKKESDAVTPGLSWDQAKDNLEGPAFNTWFQEQYRPTQPGGFWGLVQRFTPMYNQFAPQFGLPRMGTSSDTIQRTFRPQQARGVSRVAQEESGLTSQIIRDGERPQQWVAGGSPLQLKTSSEKKAFAPTTSLYWLPSN